MTNKLQRYYGAGYSHFITTSCYQRKQLLATPQSRDLLLEVIEQVRRRYHFAVVGYVIMPEHIHLLLTEPERGNPSKVMQAIKQGFARRILIKLRTKDEERRGESLKTALDNGHIWQARFYDFVVFTEEKRAEKLRYMHNNPVKRGLVQEPREWKWSSCRHYEFGERGIVPVNEEQKARLTVRQIA